MCVLTTAAVVGSLALVLEPPHLEKLFAPPFGELADARDLSAAPVGSDRGPRRNVARAQASVARVDVRAVRLV